VIFPSDIHISRSLRRRLRSGAYEVRRDTCFAQVIERCSASRNGTPADPDSTAGTWITSEMQQAYGQLHELGFAHSFETFKDGQLVGGLYGVSIGRMFYGESMFHEADDASKVAFAYLCRSMQQLGCPVIDSQVENDHMRSLGAHSIPRKAFIRYVHQYAGDAVESMPWHVLPTRLGPW
jgi:leucyl/phenylalanyl-tRNA---protein transferase